jgi:CRISPR-associated protein Cas2
MTRQFIVVVYDISNDKRRTKLHNALLNYGSPVQYSVFECLLEKEDLEKMKAHIGRIIRPRKDRVRYYHLCAACLAKTEVTSGPEVLQETDVIIV